MDDWPAEYDEEVASLLLNGRKVGTLFLQSAPRIQIEGHLFRRRKKELPRLEWTVAFPKGERLEIEDGVYENENETSELDRAAFTYKNVSYSLEWLGPEDAIEVRIKFVRKRYNQMREEMNL